jgi:hypothetical protein
MDSVFPLCDTYHLDAWHASSSISHGSLLRSQPETNCNTQHDMNLKTKAKNIKTYNSRYSLVVTHPTTNLPI